MNQREHDKERPSVEVRARGQLVRIPDQLKNLSAVDISRLTYELAVHQIELEAQNEELRRAQETINLEQARYRELFMQAPVGYLTLDNQNNIVDLNAAAAELLGLTQPMPTRQSITNFIVATDIWRLHKHVIQAMTSREVETGELQIRRLNGEVIATQAVISTIPMRTQSSGEQIRLTLIDISARKRAEEQTQQLNDALNRLAAELTAANREIEAVAHTISRELQEPLNMLEESGRKLEESTDLSRARPDVSRVREASRQISQLLTELLHLTRVGHSPFMHVRIDLTHLVHSVVKDLQQLEPDRKVKITVADGLVVQGDKRLLEMAMAKLLGNAWKFTMQQEDAHIEVGRLGSNKRQVFFVKHNGPGFDMKDADKLFKPFQRLPSAEAYPGRGFGLAMVSRIIRRHGGSIWAESSPNQGATFYFTLGHDQK